MTMGETIEFPHNQRMYFKEAKRALEANQLEQALEAIKNVYDKDKGPEVIHLYSTILSLMEDDETALDIANEQRAFFLKQEDYTISYVLLLIKNKHYLEAETIIIENLENTQSILALQWQQANEELIRHRAESIRLQEQKNQGVKQALMRLETYQPVKQHEIIEGSRELPLLDLQEVAPKIFMSPFINGMLQRSLLEILIIKRDDEEYLFTWLNQQRTVKPIELTEFEQDTELNRILLELNQRTEKQPDLKEPIYTELISDLLVLYPFIGEIVTDIPYFVNYYISMFDPNQLIARNSHPENEEQRTLLKWIEHLNQLSGR